MSIYLAQQVLAEFIPQRCCINIDTITGSKMLILIDYFRLIKLLRVDADMPHGYQVFSSHLEIQGELRTEEGFVTV